MKFLSSKIVLPIILSCGLLFLLSCSSAPKSLVIVHSNDTHGLYKPHKFQLDGKDRLVGGMEATSHYLNLLREKEGDILLVDTGDIMTGTLAAQIMYNGVYGGVMPEFLNLLDYDIRCHGNHVFDLGQENARGIEKLTKFPVVMANLIYEKSGELFSSAPYKIIKKQGLKIGVIAVMEEYFRQEVSKDKIKGINVLPIIPTLKSYVPEIRKKADVVIVLLHSKEFVGNNIAAQVPGIDIVLAASEEGLFQESNGVLIKSTFGHQNTLGYIKIVVQDKKIISYDQDLLWLWADIDLAPSPKISELVAQMDFAVESEFSKVIGESAADYKSPGYGLIENAMGNWVADVMRWKTGVQIGMQNSGGIRKDIYAGPISVKDIYEISPFPNTLIVFRMNGQQLKDALEKDIDKGRDRLQVSGLSYSHYVREAKPCGVRITRIEVDGKVVVADGEVLLPEKVFTVVSNDYVVGQAQDKYFGFPIKRTRDTGYSLKLSMIEWFEKFKRLECVEEGRIVQLKK